MNETYDRNDVISIIQMMLFDHGCEFSRGRKHHLYFGEDVELHQDLTSHKFFFFFSRKISRPHENMFAKILKNT